ncbi:MAG TPA: hypothetical protein VI916_06745, partial [Acidimicrobiia bacterium]|nr:hypothetical protein [Acidimicrobiia bacterium]
MITKGSRRVLAAAGLVFAVSTAAALPAVATQEPTQPNARELIAACYEHIGDAPVVGHGLCRGVEQLDRDIAQACRFPRPAAPTPEEVCSAIDGRVYSEAAMVEYEASWVHRALRLQAHLDDRVPLFDALIPGTHNSFNAASQPPTLSGLDHNQVASLTDQLRMDMRGIEVDVHWAPSASGDPANGMRAPVVCHAAPIDMSFTTVHAGCTSERDLREALTEVLAWLNTLGNENEFILLYLENALDDDPAAHDAAADAIHDILGEDLVYRPVDRPAIGCATMPTSLSKASIRETGARVLIVGNCGPGAWGSWVHDRGLDLEAGPVWDEDKSADGDDFVCPSGGFGSVFRRFYEDSTWLSDTVEPMGIGSSGQITAAETVAMVECGVNLFGFDQLLPADPRLASLVWSWAPNEPSAGTAARRG